MYWFITYEEDNGRRLQKAHSLSSMHPLIWLESVSNRFPKNKYYILFWSEVPKELYERYDYYFAH